MPTSGRHSDHVQRPAALKRGSKALQTAWQIDLSAASTNRDFRANPNTRRGIVKDEEPMPPITDLSNLFSPPAARERLAMSPGALGLKGFKLCTDRLTLSRSITY